MNKRAVEPDFPIGKVTRTKDVLPPPDELDLIRSDKRLMAKLRAGHQDAKRLKGKLIG